MRRTWFNHALMTERIVECVWPERWANIVDRHRGVVAEVGLLQHLKHGITAYKVI